MLREKTVSLRLSQKAGLRVQPSRKTLTGMHKTLASILSTTKEKMVIRGMRIYVI